MRGAIADLIGYYLATGVVAYVVWTALRPLGRGPADLATLSAFEYVLAGGAATVSLAFAGPRLMHAYASGEVPAAVATAFGVLTEVVFSEVWQFLDAWLLAGWWLGIGLLLRRIQPGFARLSLVLAGHRRGVRPRRCGRSHASGARCTERRPRQRVAARGAVVQPPHP